MYQRWKRPAPGEDVKLQIDPETGFIAARWHEHLWLASLRGLSDLCSDIANGRMGGRDWAFIFVVLAIMVRGS